MQSTGDNFWSLPADQVLTSLGSSPAGLTEDEAQKRAAANAGDRIGTVRRFGALRLFLEQFKSPITLILMFSAGLSLAVADRTDAAIIIVIILAGAGLGFWQEYQASTAMQKLLAIISTRATVLRAGHEVEVPRDDVVPGDIVVLSAGATVPADCLLLDEKDLFVNEAALTGETFPVEKRPGVVAAEAGISQRTNVVYLGTNVVSGTARALVVNRGTHTEFGKVSERLQFHKPETDFERGVRRFGNLLMEVTLLFVVGIFAVNVGLQHENVLEAFLFSLALAVGLTPQLLPAIISVNLASGARRMAARSVIVRRLPSIENFGSMDVLCSDKTGTLTEGTVEIQSACDVQGHESQSVRFHGWLNATFESGFANPIDEAIRHAGTFDAKGYVKADEIPYDFLRKRLSILVEHDGSHLLITKGALDNVLAVCTKAQTADGKTADLASVRDDIERQHKELGGKGYRLLGVAVRNLGTTSIAGKEAESDMTLIGYLVFRDPPKAGVKETVAELRGLGVSLKMITGDNRLVASYVAGQVGLGGERLLCGGDLRRMSAEALFRQVSQIDVFAEIEPNQKEQLILALRKAGHVVGYMGDGINDASALHAADVGISVDSAVDVAKEAADIVLLKHSLDVLIDGIREGRTTFANTLKYVFMATSANFGNMFSMAGASLFLPFLPLLPKQILFMNILTDIPEMTIATDRVDDEMVVRPRRWDIRFIRKFMLLFGVLSSVFDYLTFGTLMLVLHADEHQFRTGWFIESVVSAALIVLVVRSRRSILSSRPSAPLVWSTIGVVAMTLALPVMPAFGLLGFTAVSPLVVALMLLIVVLYLAAAEFAKKVFYRLAGD